MNDLKPLKEYCSRIPGQSRGSKAHVSTLVRHAMIGVRGPSGEQVKLRAVRFGHKWLTTDQWFAEFVAALTTGDDSSSSPRTPSARRRAAEAADLELASRGC